MSLAGAYLALTSSRSTISAFEYTARASVIRAYMPSTIVISEVSACSHLLATATDEMSGTTSKKRAWRPTSTSNPSHRPQFRHRRRRAPDPAATHTDRALQDVESKYASKEVTYVTTPPLLYRTSSKGEPKMILFCGRPVSLNLSVDMTYTHFDGVALHPRLLRSVRYSSLSWKVHERIGTLRDIVHLPEQRHEQRSLARPGWPDDEVDLAALEEHLVVDVEDECPSPRPPGSDGDRGRVCCPREGCVSHTDCVLVFLRDGDYEDLGGVELVGFGELVDELRL